MDQLPNDTHTASSVSQDNQGRVRDLGRGSLSKNKLQSPCEKPYSSKNLRILQCNINGLSTSATRLKLDRILEVADDLHVEVIALQETKLSAKRQLKVKGYNIIRKDRSSGGGGLLFLIRNVHFQPLRITNGSASDLECQGVKILSKDRNVSIINTYHPPNNKHLPLNEVEGFFEDNTLLLGDLNAKHTDWGCSTINNRGSDLTNLANDKAFLFLNDASHTYRSYSYNTTDALDVALVSPGLFPYCSWRVLEEIGSDHNPILIEITFKVDCPRDTDLRWNFRRADWPLFEQLSEELVSREPPSNDLEREWSLLKNAIYTAAKSSIPRGKAKKKKHHFVHRNDTMQSLINKRSQLLKDMIHNPDIDKKIELNKLNAEIRRSYVQIKRKNWQDTCEKLDYRTTNARLWKLAKNLDKFQLSSENINAIIGDDGYVSVSDSEGAETLAKHYAKESMVAFNRSDKKLARITRNQVKSCHDVPAESHLFNENFTPAELSYAIQSQDLTKSPGPDGLHGQFFEYLGILGRERLLYLFNLSWNSGKLPRQWKSATIIPIRKPNKEASSVDGYRPIALTCIACKLIERMILRRLSHHLLSNRLLPPEQYGFRKGHSTMDQVLFFSQHVRDAQNCSPTEHTIAAFLDLSKAFDKVWKNKLINKCFNEFNIRGKVLPWTYNFLNHRNFCVNLHNNFSGFYKLHQGIPQGSVLSPILFSLFIAGIEKSLHPCQVGIFADDIVLWCSGREVNHLESCLNDALVKLSDFSISHKLHFNASKSSCCFFTTNRHLYNYSPEIFLENQRLDTNKYPVYLGFTLDPEINCKKHIEKIACKARKRLQILKFISGRDWGADASTLRVTYSTLIRPILEYGYQIFQTASASNLKILDRVQLSAARIVTGMRNSCPSDIVLYEADILPLHLRFKLNSFRYFNKLSSFGNFNRTSDFVLNWTNIQRLKRDSPLAYVEKQGFIHPNVVSSQTYSCLPPTTSFQGVNFCLNLNSSASKQEDSPDLLRQLALEIIGDIPSEALVVYTDGSKFEDGKTGSGVFISNAEANAKISVRNPDFCSVFRSEITAIGRALDYALATDKRDICILTDSKSAIQYLQNWPKIFDRPDQDILRLLHKLSLRGSVRLQWIPSHVGVLGNETADFLAKEGCNLPATIDGGLTPSEIHSFHKHNLLANWRLPPVHNWYSAKIPGLSLMSGGPRLLQSTLARFRSGHLKCMTFQHGEKIFSACSCTAPASPAHLLDCLGASWRLLLSERELFEALGQRGLLDLV